jgi:hypothetical protein
MREILFRGQTRKYGEKVRMGDGQKLPGHWVYGGVLQGIGSHSIIYGYENADNQSGVFDKRCVHTDTLGQFTGLTDKNGKKIFEGDILKRTNGNKYVWYVDYKNCAFCANQSNCNYSCELGELLDQIELEVIGNIHDNPELLEV